MTTSPLLLNSNGQAAQLAAASTPIQTKILTNVVCNNVAFTDVDASGSAAARPSDIVIPNVTAGQWVELSLSTLISNEAPTLALTFFSIVAGAAVNNICPVVAQGIGSWNGGASTFNTPGGTVSYQLVAGDIEGGSARFRLKYKTSTAANKTILSATWPLILEGRGPFG